VDGKATTDIEELQPRAEFMQFGIEPHRLLEGVLDGSDCGDLAADMKVQQLQAIQHFERPQPLDHLDELVGSQAELRAIAARLLPLASTATRQLGAHADMWPQIESF